MNKRNESCKASLLFSNRMNEQICRQREEKIGENLYTITDSILTTHSSDLIHFLLLVSTILVDRCDRQSQLYKETYLQKKKSLSLFTRQNPHTSTIIAQECRLLYTFIYCIVCIYRWDCRDDGDIMIAYRILGNYLLSYDENAVGCAAASSLDCIVRMSLK